MSLLLALGVALAGAADAVDPDFHSGDVQITAGAGFAAGTWAPWSLFTAFAAFNEFDLRAEVGVAEVGRRTFALGLEGHYARPFLQEQFSGRFLSAQRDADFSWRLLDLGLAARGLVHFTEFESVDVYGFVLAGPTHGQLDVSYDTDTSATGSGRFKSAGVRVGGGGGLNVLLPRGWVLGGELRYVLGVRFKPKRTISLTNAAGDEVSTYPMRSVHSPPRGFGYIFHGGYRF